MNKLLEVKDLHVRFKTQAGLLHAVRGVDFSISEGEVLGIVGESGCGKSVTAKSLIKLMSPLNSHISGQVLYKGENLVELSEKRMQQIRGKEIGMIFQDPMTSLNPTMKIGHQIIEGYKKHFPDATSSAAWEYAIEMLRLVGISHPEERVDAYPHTLSGGMRQRAMIAVALACKPHLLLADEPTTALDVTIQAQILDLMKEIQQKTKTSIILITHDLSVIAHFCDRVLVMYAGKIVESAPVDQLFANPQHPYTQRLLKAIPRLDKPKNEPLFPIEGTPPPLNVSIPGCGFCARCHDAMKICSTQTPPLMTVGSDHLSACFNHDPRRVK